MSPKHEAAHEVDLIAPWRAIGRLDAKDTALLDDLLKDDPELARRLDVAEEERDATWELNEALPTPSAKARDALFARIEAYEARRFSVRGAGRWLSETIAAMSPRTLAWSAVAAALVIAVQGGFLTRAYLGGEAAGRYTTASDGREVAVPGQTVLVGFAPAATADQIATLLKDAKAEIVGGPKPGGVFVVRIADKPLAQDKLDAALKALRANAAVKFASPSARAAATPHPDPLPQAGEGVEVRGGGGAVGARNGPLSPPSTNCQRRDAPARACFFRGRGPRKQSIRKISCQGIIS